ncbi:unnamed protein product, partial [Mesorhabditis spiculigera]
MPGLLRALSYNFLAQLFGRILSFAINIYLLRVIDSNVIGIVNVRLMLMYNTILFIVREPMRKANILPGSLTQFVNIVWLSPVIASVMAVFSVALWTLLSSTTKELPLTVLFAFPLAAIIESFGEPFAVYSLTFSMNAHYAWSQCLLISLQRVFVIILLFGTALEPLYIYAYAQVMASSAYTLFHLARFWLRRPEELKNFQDFRSFFPRPELGLRPESLTALKTMMGHSVLKQMLTDGSGYVMTFTDVLSLKNQAVYDAIEKLGSLVCRLALAPLEENCAAYFRNGLQSYNARHLRRIFLDILHVAAIFGMVVTFFGVPYSKLAVSIYGGKLLTENGGIALLCIYCFYICLMAINGITECFAMVIMNDGQVATHGGFLSILAIVQFLLSWRRAKEYFNDRISICHVWPSFSTWVGLICAFLIMGLSFLFFGRDDGLTHALTHVCIGGVLLLIVTFSTVQNEPILQRMVYEPTAASYYYDD